MRAKVSKVLLALLTAICFACFAYAGPGVYAEGEETEEVIAQAETEFSVTYSDDQKEAYITGLSNATKQYTQIIIPSKIMGLPVTKINANAFDNKNTVTKVVIPDTVKVIESNAFRNCWSVTEFTIPVDVIAYDAFNNCSATKKITYTKGSTGIMPDWDESWDAEKRYSYSVANRSGNLETVVFSDGITYIGNMALFSRGKLISVTMPKNEVKIGSRSFESCTVLPSLDTSKVTSFGSRALFNCQSLADITINSKVKELPAQVFYNCYVFNNVVIPDSVESIGSEAFRNCSAIETITIPVDTKTYDSFNGCSYIKTINYTYGRTGVMLDKTEDWNQETEYRYSIAMRTGKLETVNFADGITHIGDNSLRDRENLKTVNFPNNEFTVGYAAFYQDTSAVIGDISNVTEFGQYAFQSCLGLKELTFNSAVTDIPLHCFYNCTEIEKLTIPDTVETIKSEAFRKCSGITELTIPVDTVTTDSFNECTGVKTINYTYGRTGVMVDATENWNEYDYRYTIINRATALETVNFTDGITHIGDNMLRNRPSLTTVNFPDNEFTVGYATFYQDTGLTINDISNVTNIGKYAFQEILGLKNLVINEKVSEIPQSAFRACSQIETVYIPDSVAEIGNDAFNGCSNITEITIPVDANYYDGTFSNYDNLTKVTYTKGKTGFSSSSENHNNDYYSLEKRCKNIETVIFDEGVKNIHNKLFNAEINKSIKNIKFPASLEDISTNAFVKGIDATFYGYKDTVAEVYASKDDTIEFRYLEYPYVTPDADVEAGLGEEVQFDAFVYTDIDTESKEIKWSVKDANSKKTTIDNTGKLTVGSNEKSAEIKVCASYGENTVEVPVKINRSVFIVEFDAIDGKSTEEAIAADADGKIAELPTASYDNFTFDGWYTAKDGGEKVTTDKIFNEDTVVYAHYSLTPADSVEIKAGAQPKSGDTFDTTVGKVSDNIDSASVKVSYALDGKEVTGEAKCLKTYTINVSFKLKNGFTITDASKVSVNGGNVKAAEAEGVYTVSSTFEATTHGETVLKYAKEATKTEEGYSGDKCCSICNEVLEKGKTIAKLPADSTDPTNPTNPENPENPDDGYVDASTLKIGMIKTGLLVSDKKSGGKYKITKVTKKKGKISGGYVTYTMPYNKNAKTATVKDTVTLAGVKFKVNEIGSKAFAGCAKLTKVTIGKNVTKIGANAFNGDAKLKNIIFKGTKIKKMGSNAFKGIYKKPKFKAPKKVVKKYKKMIKKAKAPKKFKITK